MDDHFTLFLLSQHYPISQQIQFFSYDEVSIDADIAGFLHDAEQEASQCVLDRISAYASGELRMENGVLKFT